MESGASVTQAADDHEMAEDHGVIPAVAADHACAQRDPSVSVRRIGCEGKQGEKNKKKQ